MEVITLKEETFSKEDKTDIAFLNKTTFLFIFLCLELFPPRHLWLSSEEELRESKHPQRSLLILQMWFFQVVCCSQEEGTP